MERNQLAEFIEDYFETARYDRASLTRLLLLVLAPQSTKLDPNIIYALFELSTQFPTADPTVDIVEFVSRSEHIIRMFNKVNRKDLWELWLMYHLSEADCVNIKFLKTMENFAISLLDLPEKKTSDIIQKLGSFCITSGILEELVQ